MPELATEDATLHVEVEGEGAPVTLFCHGLTNNRMELAPFTSLLGGTKVRFDFRGHGLSSSPPAGSYRFRDFARDVRAMADAYGATQVIGTSLGAGAVCSLLVEEPDRFERIVFLLPVGLDEPFEEKEKYLKIARVLESMPFEEALAAILSDPDRRAAYESAAWLEAYDRASLEQMNQVGVARAIRGAIEDWPVPDRELLSSVTAPAIVISREGDPVHRMVVGTELARIMPNAELIAYPDGDAMFRDIPNLVQRVAAFLGGAA